MADYQSEDPFIAPDQAAQIGATAQPAAPKTSNSQIEQWYQQYLHHGMGAGTDEQKSIWSQWGGTDPNAVESGIKNSAEAKAWDAAHAAAPAGAPGAPAGQRPSGAPNAPPAQQFQYQSSGQNPAYKAMVSALMGRALSQPNVSPDDPNIQASTAAYGADQTRAARDAVSSFAERGGSHMNTDAATLASGERAGQNTANFRGALVQKNIDGERAQIQAALNGAVGLLTAEQVSQLQQRDQELSAARFNADTSQVGWEDQYKSIFG